MSEITRKAAYVRKLYQQGLKFPAWSKERTLYHTESMWNFCNWFLPKPFPYMWFHKEWMSIACGQQFFCVLAPRDHSKSTSFGAGYPLWRLCMDQSNTIMLVSGTATVAELQLRVVKENLEANQLIIDGFGQLVPEEPVKWTNSEIIINRPPGIAHPSVVALGAGSGILSRRAKYIIADDIVRDEEAVIPEARQRLKSWITGVLVGVLEAEDQLGFIGTKKHHADYYTDLEISPQYFYRRYDAIQKEIPPSEENPQGRWETLWPEKWPESALRVRYDIQGSFQFNQNYRNISMGEDDSPFPMTWLRKCQDLNLRMLYKYPYDDFVKKVISVDLALGDKEGTGSYFVAMVTVLRQDGDFMVLHIHRERLDFPAQVKKLNELITDFSPNAIVVESNAYQGAMTSTIAAAHPELEVVAHQTGRNKNDPVEGIPMLQPLAEAGRLHFPYAIDDVVGRGLTDVLCEELNRLGVARHSDTVMALWFGIKYLAPFVVLTSRRSARATIL